jgi:hypothetical protein
MRNYFWLDQFLDSIAADAAPCQVWVKKID